MLARDAVQHICLYLDLRTLVLVARVSRDWRKASSAPVIWRKWLTQVLPQLLLYDLYTEATHSTCHYGRNAPPDIRTNITPDDDDAASHHTNIPPDDGDAASHQENVGVVSIDIDRDTKFPEPLPRSDKHYALFPRPIVRRAFDMEGLCARLDARRDGVSSVIPIDMDVVRQTNPLQSNFSVGSPEFAQEYDDTKFAVPFLTADCEHGYETPALSHDEVKWIRCVLRNPSLICRQQLREDSQAVRA